MCAGAAGMLNISCIESKPSLFLLRAVYTLWDWQLPPLFFSLVHDWLTLKQKLYQTEQLETVVSESDRFFSWMDHCVHVNKPSVQTATYFFRLSVWLFSEFICCVWKCTSPWGRHEITLNPTLNIFFVLLSHKWQPCAVFYTLKRYLSQSKNTLQENDFVKSESRLLENYLRKLLQ